MKSNVVLWNRIPGIVRESQDKTQEVLERSSARIQSGAMGRSRVDTGNMRGGWQYEFIDEYAVLVFNLVEYTIYNEFGTVNMSAAPMAIPSAEEERPRFYEEMGEVYQ